MEGLFPLSFQDGQSQKKDKKIEDWFPLSLQEGLLLIAMRRTMKMTMRTTKVKNVVEAALVGHIDGYIHFLVKAGLISKR